MERSFWNIQLGDAISAPALCKRIELECQPELLSICRQIEIYFSEHPMEQPDNEVTELIVTVFGKMVDELTHLFLKEKGLIFPGIRNSEQDFVLPTPAIQLIQHTQEKISQLLIRLRLLLNNFQMKPGWSNDWKNCVQQFFQLEKKIHQWIYIEQNMLYAGFLSTNTIN
ncbi:MAG: hypothetical protein FGM61_00845 [Sediminibacterium sp.]|nr:hypothetical protein [Sediminibacterium sp.]